MKAFQLMTFWLILANASCSEKGCRKPSSAHEVRRGSCRPAVHRPLVLLIAFRHAAGHAHDGEEDEEQQDDGDPAQCTQALGLAAARLQNKHMACVCDCFEAENPCSLASRGRVKAKETFSVVTLRECQF